MQNKGKVPSSSNASNASNASNPSNSSNGSNASNASQVGAAQASTDSFPPRVGVFVCDCGSNILGTVDVPAVAEYARGLEGVVFVDEGRWICSTDYLAQIAQFIGEHRLERVVVASCTPRTHEPLFKDAVKQAGLNPYLLEFVSIREQSSWVHRSQPVAATRKAKDLVAMGVAKALLLEPGREIRLSVGQTCLVIGGGIAGMTAALGVARQGFQVHLVEREARLGGLLNQLHMLAPADIQASELLEPTVAQVTADPNINVHLNSTTRAISGYIGNYAVQLEGDSDDTLEVSTVIVASGIRELEPQGLFGYGDHPNIVTQIGLERLLAQPERPLAGKSVALINCVGSRNEQRGCCNVGCLASIRNAITLKERDPDTPVFIFYRDLNVQGEEANYVRQALKDHDIRTVRYDPKQPPQVVVGPDGELVITARDLLLDVELQIPVDLVVLTTALVGDDSVETLRGQLKVSADANGFFQEAHIKLAPLDFAGEGLYLCGGARSPKGVRWAMEEALGAAMRAVIPMRRGYIEAPGIICQIDHDLCSECGICAKVCPYGAIEIIDPTSKQKVPRALEALCKGCGTCAAECPSDAIQIIHYSDRQIEAQIISALAQEPEQKIIAFCCHWCAMGAVDLAGVSRAEYPPNARLIRVMCSGRVKGDWVQQALDLGAGGVLVAGCEFPTCHYITGNYKCQKRIERLTRKLAKKGYETDRIWNVWMSAADGPKFVTTMKDMVVQLGLDASAGNEPDDDVDNEDDEDNEDGNGVTMGPASGQSSEDANGGGN